MSRRKKIFLPLGHLTITIEEVYYFFFKKRTCTLIPLTVPGQIWQWAVIFGCMAIDMAAIEQGCPPVRERPSLVSGGQT